MKALSIAIELSYSNVVHFVRFLTQVFVVDFRFFIFFVMFMMCFC